MSSYQKQTVHPETKQIEKAEWLDDYFGNHNYGVRFPSDGKIFRADEFFWEENPQTLVTEGRLKYDNESPTTIHLTQKGDRFANPMHEVSVENGKKVDITKHEDGRQDVAIEVKRLDLNDRTPEDTIAEEKIIDAMSKKIVTVVVIHKPTNESATFACPLPLVRKRAQEVVTSYKEKTAREHIEIPTNKDFCVVEFDAGQVRVTSL